MGYSPIFFSCLSWQNVCALTWAYRYARLLNPMARSNDDWSRQQFESFMNRNQTDANRFMSLLWNRCRSKMFVTVRCESVKFTVEK